MKYEEAIKELENITKKLESGELSLEDALSNFSKGVELIKFCRETLNSAKEKVSIIVEAGNGEKKEIDFN